MGCGALFAKASCPLSTLFGFHGLLCRNCVAAAYGQSGSHCLSATLASKRFQSDGILALFRGAFQDGHHNLEIIHILCVCAN